MYSSKYLLGRCLWRCFSFKSSTNIGAKLYVKGGAAKDGSDKIIQHNSPGAIIVSDFYVEN